MQANKGKGQNGAGGRGRTEILPLTQKQAQMDNHMGLACNLHDSPPWLYCHTLYSCGS